MPIRSSSHCIVYTCLISLDEERFSIFLHEKPGLFEANIYANAVFAVCVSISCTVPTSAAFLHKLQSEQAAV